MIGLWKFQCRVGKEKGIIALYILHSLSKKPTSGYDILKEISGKTEGKWVPSKGTLYPVLDQLEKEGMIRLRRLGSRSKKIFEVTDKGKKVLRHVHRHRESREKVMQFRALFLDIFGVDNTEAERMAFEVREAVHSLISKGKEDAAIKALKACLSELRRAE